MGGNQEVWEAPELLRGAMPWPWVPGKMKRSGQTQLEVGGPEIQGLGSLSCAVCPSGVMAGAQAWKRDLGGMGEAVEPGTVGHWGPSVDHAPGLGPEATPPPPCCYGTPFTNAPSSWPLEGGRWQVSSLETREGDRCWRPGVTVEAAAGLSPHHSSTLASVSGDSPGARLSGCDEDLLRSRCLAHGEPWMVVVWARLSPLCASLSPSGCV